MTTFDHQNFPAALTTERLVLRPLKAGDIDDQHEYHSLEEVVFFTPWPIRTEKDVATYLEKVTNVQAAELESDGDSMIFGWQHRALGKVIGQSNISLVDRSQGTVEIGYAANPEFQGQGFASEATSAVLQFAFSHSFVQKAIARIDKRASRSIRLAERLGFRELPLVATQIEQKGEERTLLHFELSRDSFAPRESYSPEVP